jgi:hypothetical protein
MFTVDDIDKHMQLVPWLEQLIKRLGAPWKTTHVAEMRQWWWRDPGVSCITWYTATQGRFGLKVILQHAGRCAQLETNDMITEEEFACLMKLVTL